MPTDAQKQDIHQPKVWKFLGFIFSSSLKINQPTTLKGLIKSFEIFSFYCDAILMEPGNNRDAIASKTVWCWANQLI